MRWIRRSLSVVLAFAVAGCAASGPKPTPTTVRPAPSAGIVRGRVAFTDGIVPVDVVVHVGPAVGNRLKPPRQGPSGRTMVQANHTFTPRVLVVERGATVEFRNGDAVYHSVFSISPAKRFDIGRYAPGARRSVTFDQAGVVNLFCALDSKMAGWVVVLDTPAFTRPDAAGDYSLVRLPAGRWTVTAWDPVHGERSRTVTLGEGSPRAATLNF